MWRELRKMSARVMREANLTGMTRAEVSRHLAAELLYASDAKLKDFQFIDAGGRRWKTEKYFNMLGRTLLHNNARECYLAGCAKGGSDIVTISVSGDCCDACGKYENALLSISGATPGLPTLEEAMAEGLFHPNCTHRIIAVPESIARKYYGLGAGSGKSGGKQTSQTSPAKLQKPLGRNIRSTLRSLKPEPEDNIKRFDGSFSSEIAAKFDKQLRDSKLSNAQVDEFNFHMKLSGHLLKKTPEFVVFTNNKNDAHTDVDTWQIYIRQGSGTWDGCRNTISHEWGELLFNNIMTEEEKKRFHIIIGQDYQLVKKNLLLNSSSKGNNDSLKSELSHAIFQKNYPEISENNQMRIDGYFDVAGSMTMGRYGFGHDNYEAEFRANRFGNDVFANVYMAVSNGYDEYKTAYPNLWKYMETLLKK